MPNTHRDYTIMDVQLDELHDAEWEPSSRLEINKSLNLLKKSIEEIGLQYPPLVTRRPDGKGFTKIDGHRRIAAIQLLQWSTTPVLVAQGSPAQLFASICATTKPVTANQWIEIYLKGGQLPSSPTKGNIMKIEQTVGKQFLERLLEAGISPQIWSLANRVIKYTGLAEETKKDVLEWLLTKRVTRQVQSWISGSSPPHELAAAFHERREPTADKVRAAA